MSSPRAPAPRSGDSSAGAGRGALWLLLAVYTVNFVDRQILNILAEPIKRDLRLADWQLGLLTGFAFALFYTVLGLPLARHADRHDRVRLMSVAIAVWSLFTAACGLARTFGQLLLLRIGVGVGEAGCVPTAHALIADTTPPDRRASALAFFSMGAPLGSMLGMAIGGVGADSLGWRGALMLVGLPGLLLAGLVATGLKDRRAAPAAGKEAPPLRAVLAELRGKPAFWWAAVGAGLASFVSYGQVAFYGSFLFRSHGPEISRLAGDLSRALDLRVGPAAVVGTGLGLAIGTSGVIGAWLGGALADRAARASRRALMLTPAVAALAGLPFLWAALFVDRAALAVALLAGPLLVKTTWYGPVYACAQGVVRPRARATSAAILLFVVNTLGLGFGPLAIGALSDLLAVRLGPAEGLRWALALSGGACALAAGCFLMARRTLERDLVS